jgi:hypothetical protein
MSNYTKATNFATKDTLTSGDPLKIVKGTEINTEFDAISTAIATKADTASPTFTGTVTIPTATVTTATITTATISAGTITGITDLAIADGGTGASTAANARTNLGLVIGTNVQAWDTDLDTWATKTAPSGTVVGTSDSQTLTNKTLGSGTTLTVSVINSGTVVASTSGTSIDFTGIPSWAKRITVMFVGVSGNGASMPTVRLGTSGGIESTGYSGSTQTSGSAVLISTGFDFAGTYQSAARVYHGAMTLSLQNSSTNTWVASAVIGLGDAASVLITGGSKSTASVVTQLRITFTNGTDAFDAGSINILYE